MVTTCSVKGCKSKAGQGIKFHRIPQGEIREAWITFLKKYNPHFMATSRSTSVCGLHFLTDLDYEITPTSIYQTKRLKKDAIPSIMPQNVRKSLLNKSNQELNCVPDHDAEEEIVTLSFSDLNGLRAVPPAIPIESCTENIVLQEPTVQNVLFTVQNASTVSPAPVIQNINTIPRVLYTVQNPSTVSPSTAVQYGNEINSVLVQSTVGDESLFPNNKRKCFMGDFKQLSDIDNPDNRLKYWLASQSTVTKQKKKIKFLSKQTVNMKKKIKDLDNLVDQLKKELAKKESNDCVKILKQQILSTSQHEIYMSMCKPI